MKPHNPTRPVGEYDDDDEDVSEEDVAYSEDMDYLPPYPVVFPNVMFPNPR